MVETVDQVKTGAAGAEPRSQLLALLRRDDPVVTIVNEHERHGQSRQIAPLQVKLRDFVPHSAGRAPQQFRHSIRITIGDQREDRTAIVAEFVDEVADGSVFVV